MDQLYEINIDTSHMPETMMYGHSTRLADFSTPAVEHILQPELEVPAHTVTITVTTGLSFTRGQHRVVPNDPVGRAKHRLRRELHARIPEIDLGNSYSLDMRFADMSNIAHLIHDLLGPFRFVERTLEAHAAGGKPIHVILPKKAPGIALRVLKLAGISAVCTDGAVRAHNIKITHECNISLLANLERQTFAWAEETPKKIFISRRGTRVLINEEEVTRFLTDKGYTRLYVEDFELNHQWALLGNATHIVGIHGAGLAALGFSACRPRTDLPRYRLVELFGPGYVNNCFRFYSAILDGRWTGVRGKITPEVIRDLDLNADIMSHQHSNFELDLESLELALQHEPKAPTISSV
jgi:hypothetical protein